MTVEAEKIIADAKRFAEVQAKYSTERTADVVRETCILAYLQGFKSGLIHAVREASGVPS